MDEKIGSVSDLLKNVALIFNFLTSEHPQSRGFINYMQVNGLHIPYNMYNTTKLEINNLQGELKRWLQSKLMETAKYQTDTLYEQSCKYEGTLGLNTTLM